MKLLQCLLLIVVLTPSLACGATVQPENGPQKDTSIRIQMAFDNKEVVIRMLDNTVSSAFLKLLPCTLEFRDYASTEKIAVLPHKLNVGATPSARTAPGDFTYYAPWGNLAVFYQGVGADSQLYVLGHIETGKDNLASMQRNFSARLEKIQ